MNAQVTLSVGRSVVSMDGISPLELLHPCGVAGNCRVLGGNCPPLLYRETETHAGAKTDCFVLAPTVAECRDYSFILFNAQLIEQELAPDGIVYVLAPRRGRVRIARLLRQHDFVLGPAFLHLPDWASSRTLLPLEPAPVQHALAQNFSPRRGRGSLMSVALRLLRHSVGKQLLAYALPSVGLVARREGARPLFEWVSRIDGGKQRIASATIHLRRRQRNGTATLLCFGENPPREHQSGDSEPAPSAIAKLSLNPCLSHLRAQEARAMMRLGPAARAAGACVPQAAIAESASGHPVLVQSALSGRAATALLASAPDRLPEIMGKIARWLVEWNRATRVMKTPDRNWLNLKVLAPAAALTPLLKEGESYMRRLSEMCGRLSGVSIPFVAVHDNLTMWNLLYDERERRLGVVDWETAREEALPLTDFFYAMVNAAAAAWRYRDIPAAFLACFGDDGAYAAIVAGHEAALRRALDISEEVAELCFHACWLGHARHEYTHKTNSAQGPYVKMVQWIALHRTLNAP